LAKEFKMVNKKPKAIVLLTAGTNCDYETEYALNLSGANAERIHINDFIFKKKKLKDYQIFIIPGGFSFGDDIAAGKVMANKIKFKLKDQIELFVKDKKPIIGICNGFQALVKLGFLPDISGNHEQETTLAINNIGKFQNRWVYLKATPDSKCIFTKGTKQTIYLPIAHGEGRFISKNQKIRDTLRKKDLIVFQYCNKNGNVNEESNPNGSEYNIAGICNLDGTILGMMPHPERHISKYQHPRWTREDLSEEGDGLAIFKNMVKYVKDGL
jgi:phosphoribosylformylglycinamidine synthase